MDAETRSKLLKTSTQTLKAIAESKRFENGKLVQINDERTKCAKRILRARMVPKR